MFERCRPVLFSLLTALCAMLAACTQMESGSAPKEVETGKEKPSPATPQNAFDQEVVIPKLPSGFRPYERNPGQSDPNLGWTPVPNDNGSGRLFVDLTSLQLWRHSERVITFEFIPEHPTTDDNTKKSVSYELADDSFNCHDKTAMKRGLGVISEDGTSAGYTPWGSPLADLWKAIRPDTELGREMQFVCAIELAPDSPIPGEMGEDRFLGTWHAEDGTHGIIAPGPIVISWKQIAWTRGGGTGHKCVSSYRLASRSTGLAYPGALTVGAYADHAYTTFVLELQGPHLEACELNMAFFTVSLTSDQSGLARFTAFSAGAVQGSGTMRRVSSSF